VPANVPLFEYVEPESSRARSADPAQDVGAFERASVVSVGPVGDGLAGLSRLAVSPNPFAGACDVRWAGDPAQAPDGMLEVFDVGGRTVARVPAFAAGAWRWQPAAGTRRGVYFVRAPGARPAAVYLR